MPNPKSKCSKCGLTIRQFRVVEKGRSKPKWFGLLNGEWTEACPASFLLIKRHKAEE